MDMGDKSTGWTPDYTLDEGRQGDRQADRQTEPGAKNFFIFVRWNFWWPFLFFLFLVIDQTFRIFPVFSLFQYISPLFREHYYFPPTLTNFPPCFRQIHLLFTYFTCISFPPHFDHDAFMHHPMHVLDASDTIHEKVPSISSQFHQKPAWKDVVVNFCQNVFSCLSEWHMPVIL